MAVLVVRDVTHSFGGPPVLEHATMRVEKGDRVCLFGRNGEGKSTLLRLIAGRLRPDEGGIDISKGAAVALVDQEVPDAAQGSVLDFVTEGLGGMRERLKAYQAALDRVAVEHTDAAMAQLTAASSALDAVDGWALQQRVETVLSKLGLDADAPFGTLSGGWRRRAVLARALALQPEVLLLDEPTNHLDIDAIVWLEDFLARFDGAIVFVTHDRAFLRRVATRIVELDRGQMVEYPADFDEYVEAKAHSLDVEQTHDALFDKKLAEEEVWIRTGIKARRTRNEGRVRALKAMRERRKERRSRKGRARIQIHDAERSGETVVEVENLGFEWDAAHKIVDGLSVRIRSGERIGLIGPNGVGKTTLLRLLMGDLKPTRGAVKHGTRLQVRYYDQLRAELAEDRTLLQTLSPDSDTIIVNGKPRHVISYLKDFLFDDAQMNAPVSVLSGGERNRLLLAKLFSEPANVLVLDEPTNDLDIETLEVLEDRLLAFDGAILLVSHDREFLDAVATQSLVFEGDGKVTLVAGGYDEWMRLRTEREAAAAAPVPAPTVAPRERDKPTKLTYGERLELAALPAEIESLEARQGELHERMSDPVIAGSRDELAQVVDELAAVESRLGALYARWEELETKGESAD